ncbi:MAG: hypothetical protein WCH39_25500 [Schlesneria sp.]
MRSLLFTPKMRKPRAARARCFQPPLEALECRILMSGNSITGPSTASTPYVQAVVPGIDVISVLTTDNTGSTPDDTVPKVGGGTYGLGGIPDGLGAFDNGDGTFTLLVNQEIGNTLGVVHDHGAIGAYISRFVIDKNTLAVNSGEDLMKSVYGWDVVNQKSNSTPTTFAFNRYCSADLPEVSAYYNSATGLGSQARIFMYGEEGGSTGWARAAVVTGADAGKTYMLGKFNLSTNGSGLTGVGAWENLLANPYPQNKTVVIGNNDGGTGIMNNALAVYVGTKTNTGTEIDKAGLTNGTMKFVNVTGNTAEVVNTTTRATNITNGTRFTLSGTASTTFSRPEDGAWDPNNPNVYYFVTTDQLDKVSDGLGSQIGQTRLWRMTFDDITNPDAGGKIDLLINGQTVAGQKVNMFDNIAVSPSDGKIYLEEDVGGAEHNGKIWEYDTATFNGTTNSGVLTMITKHDPARFGDVGVAATSPFNNDEETSGIIDITAIMASSTLNQSAPGGKWLISSDQAHYTTGITTAQVEGGQLFVLHINSTKVTGLTSESRTGFVLNRTTGLFESSLEIKNNTGNILQGNFSIVLKNLPSDITVTAKYLGTSLNVTRLGNGDTVISLPKNLLASLASGAKFKLNLAFGNPLKKSITFTTDVFTTNPPPA